jgi:anti-sigma B factor antagonist
MEINERKVKGVCVVGLKGRLNLEGSETLAQRLHQLIDDGERSLIIDGETLEYISSAGFRVLLVAANRLKGLSGKIVLSSLKPHILDVFEVAGFKSIFPIYDNSDQAAQQTSV